MGFNSSSGETSSDEGVLRLINGSPSITVHENSIKKHICDFVGCNKLFNRASRLKRHKSLHTGLRPYNCKYEDCDKKYTNSSHLKRHVQAVHEKDPYNTTIRCSEVSCRRRLANRESLKKHYNRFHAPDSLKFKCTECSEVFKKKSDLAHHLYTHTGVAPYNCNSCSKGFVSSYLYKRHMKNHKTYTCNCGEEFDRWTKLLLHKRISHAKFTEYECDDCKKKFISKGNLKKHMIVHSEQRIVFQCPEQSCPRFYVKKGNLTQHVKTFHKGKKFECTIEGCGRKLSTKQKLQGHLRLHTSTRVPRKRNKNRKKRIDANKPKKAMALTFAGLEDHTDISKKIIAGEHVDDISLDCLTFSESEMDTDILPKNNSTNAVVLKESEDIQKVSEGLNFSQLSKSVESSFTELKIQEQNHIDNNSLNITQLTNNEQYGMDNILCNVYFQSALQKLNFNFEKSYVDSEEGTIVLFSNKIEHNQPISLKQMCTKVLQMKKVLAPDQILNLLLNNIPSSVSS